MTRPECTASTALLPFLGLVAALLASLDAGAWVVRADTPSAHLDTLPPSAQLTRTQPSPTSADRVSFGVVFSEPVGDTFTSLDVSTTTGSLEASLNVVGEVDVFTVEARINDTGANGVVAIELTGEITDAFLNRVEGGLSPEYTIYNWPGFLKHPQSGRLYAGETHTFSAEASCGGVAHAFEWYRSRSGEVLALGANTSAMEIAPVMPGNSGDYWCRVDFEGTPHDSNTATLEVADHLIMANPPLEARTYVGNAHTFVPEVSGGFAPLRFEWRKGSVIVGTGPVLTLPSVTMNSAGWYYVTVADNLTDQVSAGPIGLDVAPRIAIVSGPAEARRYEGESASFSVQANGGFAPLTCGWHSHAGSLGAGFSLDLANLAEADSGPYWATVADAFTGRASSNTVTLTVRPHLQIVSQPQGATVNEGDSHTFAVAVEGGFAPFAFTWMHNDAPVGTGSTLTLHSIGPIAQGDYMVQVEDDNGDVVVSAPAGLEVLAAPLPALLGRGVACLLLFFALAGWTTGRRGQERSKRS